MPDEKNQFSPSYSVLHQLATAQFSGSRPPSLPSSTSHSGSQSLDPHLSDTQPSGARPSDSMLSEQFSGVATAEFGAQLYRRERLIPAFGTWQPYYNEQGQPDRNGRHVKLILLELACQRGWRVCVWGANGVGMELDYHADERARAEEMWKTIDTRCLITPWNLRKMGFRNG